PAARRPNSARRRPSTASRSIGRARRRALRGSPSAGEPSSIPITGRSAPRSRGCASAILASRCSTRTRSAPAFRGSSTASCRCSISGQTAARAAARNCGRRSAPRSPRAGRVLSSTAASGAAGSPAATASRARESRRSSSNSPAAATCSNPTSLRLPTGRSRSTTGARPVRGRLCAACWRRFCRHCERSEAIQSRRRLMLDCFVAALLAMTAPRNDDAGNEIALAPFRKARLMTVSARLDNMRVIRAPRGPERTAKSWLTEAPLRMLMNNLDPDVAERPGELVVYGGIGRAARDWQSFDRIVAALRTLEADETLLVQSGKPVGVFRTHADAPRVLIANSNLVPHWATWEHFNELDRKGLMMFGQMTAGSWIYIGSQGIVQGTYETFGAAAKKHYSGVSHGRWILTGGLGGMGGAQPLAATMAGFSMLAVECDETRIDKRLASGYLDHKAKDLDRALEMIENACRSRRAISVGLLGNAAEILPEIVKRGITPDLCTDQTSAHDPLN